VKGCSFSSITNVHDFNYNINNLLKELEKKNS